jgi:subtilisin family serine protease
VVVGVIDDGFDLGHPDLANKAVAPWDFERNSADVHPEPDPMSPIDGNWHGTACAAVAVGNAGGGHIIGAAPNARLMPVRMNQALDPDLVAKWFDHMTDQGAWVVSCSWGAEAKVFPLCMRISDAIARCARKGRNGKGCVILFAAGNDKSDIDDPPRTKNGLAIHPDVMAISACSSQDAFSDYSNFGKDVWVCAPSSGSGGWDVTTADATGTYIDASGRERSSGYASGDYNPHFTGTSSACPLAAGVCALVLSANPELTSAEVRDIIKRTARKIGPASDYRNGRSVKFGFGCVDAEAAVREALRVAPPAAERAARRESASVTAGRAGGRRHAPTAVTRAGARSAMPNLFDFIIGEALAAPGATAESVAEAIARSPPFLTAVQLGMAHVPPAGGIPSKAQMTRIKLGKAFSAPTSGTMFS